MKLHHKYSGLMISSKLIALFKPLARILAHGDGGNQASVIPFREKRLIMAILMRRPRHQ